MSVSQTAFAKALEDAASNGGQVKLPSHFTAADTLNVANKNDSLVSSVAKGVSNIPSFVQTSLISGANELYHIPANIGNLFGANRKVTETQDIINALDSDLGQFYKDNQQSADLAGFLVSSLVPGTGGVKLLNLGQKSLSGAIATGRFGSGTARALGLLVPSKEKTLARAIEMVANNSAPAGLLHRNSLKHIGSGLGQSFYEALAFETAVTATMFNSPVLENQEFGDFVSNVLWGAGIFGLASGSIDAIKLNTALKKTADKAAVEARPWTFIDEPLEKSNLYERLALDIEQLDGMQAIPKGLDPSRETFLRKAADNKRANLEARIKINLRALAGDDNDVSSALFKAMKGGNKNDKLSGVIGLAEVSKFTGKSKLANREEYLFNKVMSQKATAKEIDEYAASDIHVNYMRTWGEDAGVAFTDKPTITSLIDTTKKGESIKVDAKGVVAGNTKYPFNISLNLGGGNLSKKFNILKMDKLTMDARYLWAQNLDLKAIVAKNDTFFVHVEDFPLMEKIATDLNAEELSKIRFVGKSNNVPPSADLKDFIAERKLEVAQRLADKKTGKDLNQEEIASIVNMKSKALSGELTKTSDGTLYHIDDVMARQSYQREYTQKLIDQGEWKPEAGLVPIHTVPRTLKLVYNGAPAQGNLPLKGINNFVAENMVIIKEQQKLYQEGVDRAVSDTLGISNFDKLVPISSGQVYSGAVPSGAGHGIVTAASSNYGTLASMVENLGAQTSKMIGEAREKTQEILSPLLYKLANDQAAAIEWSTLNTRLRSIEGEYSLNAAGDAFEPTLIKRWKEAAAKAEAEGTPMPKEPEVPANMELNIPIKSQKVRDLAAAHIEVNGNRTRGLAKIRTAQGMQFNRGPDVFYPIPVNTNDFPFFARVTDKSITSDQQVSFLYATSKEQLDDMIKRLSDNPHLDIKTKGELKKYFEGEGDYSYELGLNQNYLNTMMHRKGVSAPYFVPTDPAKITEDMLKWHMQRESGLVREAIKAKYQPQFDELQKLGDEFTNVESSRFDSRSVESLAEKAANNPFGDYVKTALAMRKDSSYPWWVNTNKLADQVVTTMLNRANQLFDSTKSVEELNKVNQLLKESGYKGAAYDESMEIFANARADKGALSKAVQTANAILATVVLRWDALNATVNAVSANILLGSELKYLMRSIEKGDVEAAGKLAALAKIKVPGTDKSIVSAHKLVSNSMMKFGGLVASSKEEYDAGLKWYKDNGYITRLADQYSDTLNAIAFKGDEEVGSWNSRLKKVYEGLKAAGDKGEKWTGNKLAEEFNRFVAADVMKQITDIAIEAKVMTPKEQLSYINTFVNRTQGNYLAAQRPMLFQGPIGQSIGLFQTYQFNLLQQLFRYVGEGTAKDAMTLLGLQATIHGMNGLPAFNAINTHIVGTASGNSEYKDFYSETYRAVGKEAGDWLMYGVASNALGLINPELKVNLYTRGDLNPRHMTLVPINPADIAIVQTSAKMFKNIFDTADQLEAGADVSEALLTGLQNNSISRPLAGLAQTLRGMTNVEQASYSTTRQGNVIAANDLVSLTSLVRLAGGKPLDEAVATDALFRNKLYANREQKAKNVLGRVIKSKVISGQDLTQEEIEEFAGKYAEAGGKQEQFNKWMTQLYKSANTSQINQLKNGLESPYSKHMQLIMGGEDVRDFSTE